MLAITGLSVSFGGVAALTDVRLEVTRGQVHGLIGPNGAGKTTLLNCISRLIEPKAGTIQFLNHDLLARPPHAIAGLGIARTFQNFGLLNEHSVLDNVIAGMHVRNACTVLDETMFPWRRVQKQRDVRRKAWAALAAFGMEAIADVPVRSLAYGVRKLVELARATAVDPVLLLLDEPTAGLSATDMDQLKADILTIRQRSQTTMLIISHHMDFLLTIADRVTVLNLGTRIASDTPEAIRTDASVIAAYLGPDD